MIKAVRENTRTSASKKPRTSSKAQEERQGSSVGKEEAEEIKKKLEAAGAKVEVK